MENGWYDSISLSDYLGVVWRRKWIVLFVMLLVAATAALYARHEKALYSASATVVSPSQTATANKNGTAATWASDNQGYVNKPGLAALVIANGGKTLSGLNPFDVANSITSAPTVTGNGLVITATSSDPLVAKFLANGYAAALGQYLVNSEVYGNPVPTTKPRPGSLQWNLQAAMQKVANDYSLEARYAAIPADASKAAAVKNSTIPADQHQVTSLSAAITTLKAGAAKPTTSATSATQTQPMTTRDVAIGAAVGLVVGILLAFLQDLLDTRVRSSDEVQRRLRLPLLAKVPAPPKGAGAVVMLDDPTPRHRPSAEAYRILKLNLLSALRERGIRTVLVTAGGDNEGTSSVTANLAVVLARSGLHVVLVDANLRTPVQHRLFQLGEGDGLADVVTGKARLADVLKVVDVAHHTDSQASANGGGVEGLLEVLPAGTIPADSADLLDNRVATALLGTLRDRADVVLVDSPAALPTTDAMVLATKVDAIVTIARARLALRPEVVALRRAVASVPALAIGFVFTGTSAKERIDYGGGYAVPDRAPAGARLEEELPGTAREATLR